MTTSFRCGSPFRLPACNLFRPAPIRAGQVVSAIWIDRTKTCRAFRRWFRDPPFFTRSGWHHRHADFRRLFICWPGHGREFSAPAPRRAPSLQSRTAWWRWRAPECRHHRDDLSVPSHAVEIGLENTTAVTASQATVEIQFQRNWRGPDGTQARRDRIGIARGGFQTAPVNNGVYPHERRVS